MKKIIALVSLLAASSLAASAAPETWSIDAKHSGVSFAVRNFFVPVEGMLKIQEGAITHDPANIAANSVEAIIAVTSINTMEPGRDKHLNNQDFFLTSQFPTATFKSTKWVAAGENKFKVTGDMTIKGVTKPVTLDVALLGTGAGPRGGKVSGWQATGTISRKAFGVDYGPQIADEVELTINVQGMQKSAAATAATKN